MISLDFILSTIEDQEERDKFEELYREYLDTLLVEADQITNNKEDSEDAVQEALLYIAVNMKKIDDVYSAGTRRYLILTVRSRAKNILYKNQKYVPIDDESTYERIDDSVLAELCNKDTERIVAECVKNIGEIYRDILYLYFAEEMKPKEISKMLNIKYSTVTGRIQRGKAKLAELLKKELCINE